MAKEKYEKAELDITRFVTEDVLLISNVDEESYDLPIVVKK